MDSALHSENFTSPAERAGAPLVPDSADTATQNTNNNDESIVTKYLVESVTVLAFLLQCLEGKLLVVAAYPASFLYTWAVSHQDFPQVDLV